MERTRPLVAITLGDASGVGPEVVARALARPEMHALAQPLAVGDAAILSWGSEIAGVRLALRVVRTPAEVRDVASAGESAGGALEVAVLDHGLLTPDAVPLGQVSAAVGRATAAYSRTAVELALQGHVDAVVSAPSSKEALHLAYPEHEGDAALFASLAGVPRVHGMIGVDALRVFNVTQHVALARVAALITRERVLEVIRVAAAHLPAMGVARPRIAVAGLNPHASDGGLFGQEEAEAIAPAVAAARSAGIDASGPLPDDTVLVRARRGEFDAVVAMFHAQSNVAVKMVGFGRGVSATLGLPFPRVTTAHGTGFDIAGRGVAEPGSLLDAYALAVQMAAWHRAQAAASRP